MAHGGGGPHQIASKSDDDQATRSTYMTMHELFFFFLASGPSALARELFGGARGMSVPSIAMSISSSPRKKAV